MQPISYTIPDAVKATGACRSRIFDEIKAGRLKARKMGRRTIILAADLSSWVDALPQRLAA